MTNATIISTLNNNINTNNIKLNLNEGATVIDALNEACAQCFFQNVEAEDLVEGVITYNGFDADVLGDSLADAELVDGDILEISVYGECRTAALQEQQEAEHVNSGSINITVALAGGITTLAKTVAVGTTINSMYDTQVSNFFGGLTKCQFDNMIKEVNGCEVDSDYELEEGDEVTMSMRKAGTKGSVTKVKVLNDESKVLTLSNATQVGVTDLFQMAFPAPAGQHYVILATGSDGSIILGYEDDNQTGGIPCNGNCDHCAHYEDEDDEDFDDEDWEDEEEEDDAELNFEETDENTRGTVKVYLPGGLTDKEVLVISGRTTLREVVTANSMLALTGLTVSQAEGLIYTINDCEAELDAVLEAGDVVTMSARAAGHKGC